MNNIEYSHPDHGMVTFCDTCTSEALEVGDDEECTMINHGLRLETDDPCQVCGKESSYET